MKLVVLFKIIIYTSLLMSYTPIALAATSHGYAYFLGGAGLCLALIIFFVTFLLRVNRHHQNRYYRILQRFKQSKRDIHTINKSMKKLIEEQQDNQDLLEERVQERTLELNIALQELESVNQELERINIQDELTGLHNRRFYDQKIVAEYRRSRRNHTPLSLIVIDIDHFKAINDNHGHLAGDHCLVVLAKYVKQSLKRSTDKAFRYGGEEFCITLPDTDAEGAFIMTEALRKDISEQVINYGGIEISLTISCGISTYQQEADIGPEQIFSAADKALYQAKHNGRNQTIQHSFTE